MGIVSKKPSLDFVPKSVPKSSHWERKIKISQQTYPASYELFLF
jgi:hypothetical protein